MSGGKKAPIDTQAADALSSQGRRDYQWTTSNFQDVFDDINYNIPQSEIDAAAGPAPDKAAIRAELEAATPRPVVQGRGGLAGSSAEAMWRAEIDKKLADRYSTELGAWDNKRATTGQQLIKEREQTKFGQEINTAENTAVGNVQGAQRGSARAQSRMGLRAATPEVQAEIDRVRAFDRAEAKASASNTTRVGLRDASIRRAQIASGIGAGIKKMGTEALGTAADMAAERNKYNATQTSGGTAGALGGALVGGLTAVATGGLSLAALGAAGAGAYQGYN